MSVWYWLYEIIIGTIEVILLGKGILGLEIRKGWKRNVALAGAYGVAVLGFLMSVDGTTFSLLWTFIMAFCTFKEKTIKLFQTCAITYLVRIIMDVLLWSIAILVVPPANLLSSEGYDLKCGLVAFCIWLIIYIVLKYKKSNFYYIYQNLSGGQITLLIMGLLTMNFFIGGIEGVLFGQMTIQLKKISLLFCVLSVFFILITYGVLAISFQKRRSLEERMKLHNQYIDMQKKYYEKSIEKYEELRSYRHDIRNHIQIINRFCEDKAYDGLTEYVRRLDRDYAAAGSVYTGNTIVDCLLSEMLEEFSGDASLETVILGRLPEKLLIENVDVCILFSNAFRNAQEALKKQKGKKRFFMQIRQGKSELYIQISNSVIAGQVDISVTDKEDSEEHGYGTKNMKKVVEQYHGEIAWKVIDGMMQVEIYLPYCEEVI